MLLVRPVGQEALGPREKGKGAVFIFDFDTERRLLTSLGITKKI